MRQSRGGGAGQSRGGLGRWPAAEGARGSARWRTDCLAADSERQPGPRQVYALNLTSNMTASEGPGPVRAVRALHPMGGVAVLIPFPSVPCDYGEESAVPPDLAQLLPGALASPGRWEHQLSPPSGTPLPGTEPAACPFLGARSFLWAEKGLWVDLGRGAAPGRPATLRAVAFLAPGEGEGPGRECD